MDALKTKPETPEAGENARRPVDWLAIGMATAGGAGFVPKAPGTAGSLLGVLLYLGIAAGGLERFYLPITAALLALGTWAAWHVEAIYGHDASRIVIDEVVGQMVTLGLAARADPPAGYAVAIAGFLIFRFFDILKPFPLGRLERLPGGLGVMADDVGAGIYGLLSLLFLEPLLTNFL